VGNLLAVATAQTGKNMNHRRDAETRRKQGSLSSALSASSAVKPEVRSSSTRGSELGIGRRASRERRGFAFSSASLRLGDEIEFGDASTLVAAGMVVGFRSMSPKFERSPAMARRCLEGGDGFDNRRQLAELESVTSSRAASAHLAENYVGLPFDLTGVTS
jgi:hypothetical protein